MSALRSRPTHGRRVETWATVGACLAVCLAAACSQPMSRTAAELDGAAAAARPAVTRGAAGEARAADAIQTGRARQESGRIPPEGLLPDQGSVDEVIARVGDLEVRERHVYEHLVQTEPAAPRRLLEVIVLDAMVAQAARRWGIDLDAATVEAMANEQANTLRAEVERQLGARLTFGSYLERQFGMSEAEYEAWLRTKLVRELYRQYVLRYAALREDRVEVRYIVNADRKVLEEVADRVRQGASFATLAIRHSEDANRMDGGLLPPFGSGFDHPVVEEAMQLSVGQLSDIFMRETQGSARFYLVYCLRRLPGRDVEFAAVADEIRRETDKSPLSSTEFRAASRSLRAAMESLNSDGEKR